MLRSFTLLFVGLSLLPVIAGCGGDGTTADSGPVASTPLKGTVDGKPFAAMGAIAEAPFTPGETKRFINIFPEAVGCTSGGTKPTTFVLISLPWMAGYTKDFGLGADGQTATFVTQKNGTSNNNGAIIGRVEVIDAPTDPKTPGKLRLRAVAGDDNVEGEVSVEVCAGF